MTLAKCRTSGSVPFYFCNAPKVSFFIGEGGIQEGIHDLQRQPFARYPGAQGKDVGIVMEAGGFCGMPGTLLAVMEMPMPVPQIRIPHWN